MEHTINRTQPLDSQYREHNDYLGELRGKFKYYRATPDAALLNATAIEQWGINKKWAITSLVPALPRELATSVFRQYVKKWEDYVLANGNARSANIWLREIVKQCRESAQRFPVPIDDLYFESGRKAQAQIWCDKCVAAVTDCASQKMSIADTKEVVKEIGLAWGFTVADSTQQIEPVEDESHADFVLREADELAWFSISRFLEDKWWERKIDRAYRQFHEHCQIINGRVHQGASRYLSAHGLGDFRARKMSAELAMSKMVARNEQTGEEIDMLDIIKGSVANPEIRRKELMCRMRGFEDTADEHKLIGGFFTFTAASKYHAFNKRKDGKGAYRNKYYQGASPRETQAHLVKVFSRARAKLKRLDMELIGFRVVEPHHDGTPHWHAAFFFNPKHEPAIRQVFADYFTREDRAELDVSDDEFALWEGAVIDSDLFDEEKAAETKALITSISARISARFKCILIDPSLGSATSYIAKYISKNINGYKIDDEEGKPADKSAELACGWASTWRIRQFQQIGGPSVSVWRELRRLPQDEYVAAGKAIAKEQGEPYVPEIRTLIDIQAEHKGDNIEVARIAADLGNWSMYIKSMGGLFCTRKNFPVAMVYKPVDNAFGETVKKLKGLGAFDRSMVTRSDDWSIVKKASESEGVDLKRNDSSALGALSLSVLGDKINSVEEPLIEQAGQLGVIISESEAQILSAGGRITLSNRIVGEERRIESMRLAKTSLNRGSDLLEINYEVKNACCLVLNNHCIRKTVVAK